MRNGDGDAGNESGDGAKEHRLSLTRLRDPRPVLACGARARRAHDQRSRRQAARRGNTKARFRAQELIGAACSTAADTASVAASDGEVDDDNRARRGAGPVIAAAYRHLRSAAVAAARIA